ncbi:hypothetical protein EUTSA_v10014840mg [Eutrema salsugineum]|uniref:Uncharacterized protein n=1 Tax=Eutrema salsugineum TaxID=72664 RepID=V4KZP3_EUTSA|nr:hypothetical protein EUTSA_v10014840mg [Eutrema salsugineum]
MFIPSVDPNQYHLEMFQEHEPKRTTLFLLFALLILTSESYPFDDGCIKECDWTKGSHFVTANQSPAKYGGSSSTPHDSPNLYQFLVVVVLHGYFYCIHQCYSRLSGVDLDHCGETFVSYFADEVVVKSSENDEVALLSLPFSSTQAFAVSFNPLAVGSSPQMVVQVFIDP